MENPPQRVKRDFFKMDIQLFPLEIKFKPDQVPGHYTMSIQYTSECQAVASVYTNALEERDPIYNVTQQLQPDKQCGYEQNRHLKKGEKQTASFDKVVLNPQNEKMFLKEIQKEKSSNSYFYPMIIRLEIPEEHKKLEAQVLYTFFTFTKESAGIGFAPKLLYQKLELGYDTWVVKNMFSISEAESCTVENLKDQCIVCCAENVDIVALPCRHLCIGLNCANKIREDKKHRECPVCRNSR